jgi:hypothetical protein
VSRVYSAQLAVGTRGFGEFPLFEVPAGEKAVLLSAYIQNVGAWTGNLRVKLQPAVGSPVLFYRFAFLSNGGLASWEGRVVLNAGDSVVVEMDADFSFLLSGYRFLA